MKTKGAYVIPQLIRADKILEALSQSELPMSLTQVMAYTGETKNNCFRILETLSGMNWVERIGGHFQLGLVLGHYWSKKRDMIQDSQEKNTEELKKLER